MRLALALIAVLGLVGAGCVVLGVALLFGAGWALIMLGVSMTAGAVVLAGGLRAHG